MLYLGRIPRVAMSIKFALLNCCNYGRENGRYQYSIRKKLKQLKHILYLLQSNPEEFKEEVDRSYALLQIGEKTEFTKSIEKRLSDPLGDFSNISDKIDQEIKGIIKSMAKNFFNHNMLLIEKVLISNTSLNHLHYSIILKEDNIDNRSAIFEFLI